MSNAAPTQVRYVVIASATLMSVLLYLDRFCISVAEVYIQEDLGLTNTQVGWMLSAFFWTYALGQVPAGRLTDRFGARSMLTIYVLAWSLFTGLTGAVSSFAAVLLLRFGFGFAQAGAYPTAAKIVGNWAPLRSRGKASSIVAFGGRIGGFLALFATGYLLVALVPSTTPAELSNSDILDAPRLCRELAGRQLPANETSPIESLRERCFEQFSPHGQSMVARHAAVPDSALPTPLSPPPVPPKPLSAADVTTIVAELNGIISTRGFFRQDELSGVPLEKEATRLLRQVPAELSEQQSKRLNRLVIEGLYRESIKKIYVVGWRPMMFVYGALGLFVAALIWWNCRSTPEEHPGCNAAEVALIQRDSPQPLNAQKLALQPLPLEPLLTSRSMWLSCLAQWFTNVGWVFLMTWAPRYFADEHQVSIETRAVLVSIPPLVGWAGMLFGGTATDLAVRRLGLRWGRALPISASRFLAMSAYIVCLFEPNVYVAVICFSTVAFATDLGTGAAWAFYQDIGGRHVAAVLGWGNMWGNLGAAVTPPLLIAVIGPDQNWNYAFAACAAAFFVAGSAALGIDASRPLFHEPQSPFLQDTPPPSEPD